MSVYFYIILIIVYIKFYKEKDEMVVILILHNFAITCQDNIKNVRDIKEAD